MIEKTILIKNSRLYYQVEGKGPLLMLLHGFAEDGDLWRYQRAALSAHYTLITPDLPGSGHSDMIDDMTMDGLADSLRLILDQELPDAGRFENNAGSPRVTMIGHSMGGYITLAFAEKYPAMLQAIGLFHSTAFADTDEKKATRRRGIRFIQTHGSAEFIQQSAPNLFAADYVMENKVILEEMIARYSSFDPQALISYYESMILRPDRTAVLQSFNKPVLFIIGKQDKAVPFDDSMKQSHMPALAFIEILENAAHMGMWEEKERGTQILLSFLQDAIV